jgi:hypothetical protein
MRKPLLLLVFVLWTSAIQAQRDDNYSLIHHKLSGRDFDNLGIMQQHDRNFVINTFVSELGEEDLFPLGSMFYKISPTNLSINDSLFIADTTRSFFCLLKNPNGDGNLRCCLEYHEECDSMFLRISHFPDDGFIVNPEEDVVTPLCDSIASIGDCFIDGRGDLILKYSKMHLEGLLDSYDSYIVRLGLDGTLKLQAQLTENEMINWYADLRMLTESPLQYYQWHAVDTEYNQHSIKNIGVMVIDSLFHQSISIFGSVLNEEPLSPIYPYPVEYEYINIDFDTEIIPIGGGEILVAAQYVNDTDFFYNKAEHGVAVVKYDLRTMQMKDYIVFNDFPGRYNTAQCEGFKQMSDGTVYLIYKERGYPEESVVVVKMDTNLNVEWKRFCKTNDIAIAWWPFKYSVIDVDEQDEEKGIAWIGFGMKAGDENYGLLCFYLNHDGTAATNESSVGIRPYMFYPNPAQDQLHLQYSPDVQPAHIELIDLQGRLVRLQGKAFETFDLGMLPAGTYTLRVTMEDGQVFADKVVKE